MAPQKRSSRTYERRGPKREQYAYVAIVSEGTRTEPTYFEGLRSAYRLSSANVHITPAKGTDPLSVVTHGEKLLKSHGYDVVYCVFDRDTHTTYDAALERIEASAEGKRGRLVAVPSWPCFEVWILLHFRYSTAAFERAGRKSPAAQALAELLTHLPQYEKANPDIFDLLKERMADALRNAKRLEKDNLVTKSRNPATRVHSLVDYLCKLKRA